jgi:hypothetical protein
MKKILLSIGMLLFLQSSAVSAAPSVINQQYLNPVLTRIDDGLARASLGRPANNYLLVFLSWVQELATAIVGSIDTENRIVLQMQDLVNVSPCLQNDLRVLEEKIEEINEAMKRALEEKRVIDILMLQDLLQYTNTRYNHLVRGSTDPGYEDEDFYDWNTFDTTTWCCLPPKDTASCVETDRTTCSDEKGIAFKNAEACGQVCQSPNPEPAKKPDICPFDSNYLPPTEAGYGCDAVAMAEVTAASDSFVSERNALSAFEQQRDAFLESYSQKLEAIDSVLQLVRLPGQSTGPLRTNEARAHKRVTGCTNSADASLPEGAARIALRNPLSLSRDEFSIARLADAVLRERGGDREYEDSLKLPSEYPEGSQEQIDATAREFSMPGWMRMLRTLARSFFTKQSVEQAGKDALPLIQSIDVQQRVANEFAVLRAPNMEFGILASVQERGVRKFVKNYATFLQKSCIFRPCNSLLGRVLGIVDDDDSFPYTNGEFKK